MLPGAGCRAVQWSLGWCCCSVSGRPRLWEAEECSPGCTEARAAAGCCLCSSECWHAAMPEEPALEPLECQSCSRPTELWAGEIAQECAPQNLLFSVQLELVHGAWPKDLSCSSILLLWCMRNIFGVIRCVGHQCETPWPELLKWPAGLWLFLGITLNQCSWY